MKKSHTLLEIEKIVSLPNPDFKNPDVPLVQLGIQSRRKEVNKLRLRGYSNKEIADKLDCSTSTVEKINHHIRETAKQWYQNESIADYCESLNDSIILCDSFIEDLQVLYVESNVDDKLKVLEKILQLQEKKYQLYSKTKAVQAYLTKF